MQIAPRLRDNSPRERERELSKITGDRTTHDHVSQDDRELDRNETEDDIVLKKANEREQQKIKMAELVQK